MTRPNDETKRQERKALGIEDEETMHVNRTRQETTKNSNGITRHDLTRNDKRTRLTQDNTRHDKTKQDKTDYLRIAG